MALKLSRLLIISALLIASGAHLIVLQSYAWATMTVANLRIAPIREAVAEVFNGRHPCHVCLKVKKASQTESKSRLSTPELKLDLFHQTSIRLIVPLTSSLLVEVGAAYGPSPDPMPFVPPPEVVAA